MGNSKYLSGGDSLSDTTERPPGGQGRQCPERKQPQGDADAQGLEGVSNLGGEAWVGCLGQHMGFSEYGLNLSIPNYAKRGLNRA